MKRFIAMFLMIGCLIGCGDSSTVVVSDNPLVPTKKIQSVWYSIDRPGMQFTDLTNMEFGEATEVWFARYGAFIYKGIFVFDGEDYIGTISSWSGGGLSGSGSYHIDKDNILHLIFDGEDHRYE